MTDLPPDVRDRAARAAFRAYWERETVSGMAEHHWRDAVKAVVSVVAPEIARPLQARIEELQGEMSELIYDASIELVGLPAEARTRLSQAINEARELLAKGEKP